MSSGGSSVPRIQVFRPTMDEFKNFSKYIEKIESFGVHKAGLAKIIPPEGWHPRKRGYDDIDLVIPAPISQVVTGRQGLYQQINIQQKAMTVKEFKKLAESNKYKTPPHFDYEDLERKYWKNITYNSPIYGADVSGSLYDDGIEEFNIQHLNTILDMVKEDYEIQIEGVNTAYLYFGMWKTTFAWHTEDMDLYSINYLHFGAPKSWYVVPPEHGRRLERLASGFFHGSYQSCPAFLRHKMTIISPQILKQYSIPYSKITQEPGEFMITFPFGYHSGFNHGFNCAESTNFALPRWVEYGKRTISCTCRNDCVKICMDMFVRKFQPDRYELWKAGKDFGAHPEDPSRHYAAPAPKKLELALSAQREERKKAKMTQYAQKIKRHPISKVEKLDGRKESQGLDKTKQSFQCGNSDSEETEIYDVDEVISNKTNKNSKKNVKKSDDSIKHVETTSCESTPITDNSVVEPSNEPANSFEMINNPPQLKPFWDPEGEKIGKNPVSDIKENTVSTMDSDYQKHVNILDQYPQLKQAITSGTMSVLLVKPETEVSKVQVTAISASCMKMNHGKSMNETMKNIKTSPPVFANTDFPNNFFSQNWKCEQTNGLKIKFVQPKKMQQNLAESKLKIFEPQANEGELNYKSVNIAQISNSEFFNEKQQIVKMERSISNMVAVSKKSPKDNTKDISNSPNVSSMKVKRADFSLGNWAQPLRFLWQHQPHDFEAECKFNEQSSSIDPHCAICAILNPIHAKNSFSTDPVNVPPYSTVRMPAFCYGNTLNSECLLDTNPLLLRDGSAPLLVCTNCKVCVHATCYGITMLQMSPWICARCAGHVEDAECCLCVLRGGALKPTNDGRWAHVVCAILIPETYFENTIFKQPVNVSCLTSGRQRLKCKYCFKSTSVKEGEGACVQCQSGKCYLPFHVTCGYMAGVIFETSDWPEPINMICTRHAMARRKPVKRHLTNIDIGQKALSKHKNKRYYWATVKEKYMQDYYSILFDDNSHSTNTLPEDIVSKNVAVDGPPEMNEKIQVKWTDDKVYNGIFKGSQSGEIFVVEFDDGSILHQERQKIYAADEELPKEVISKMSHSSERKNDTLRADTDGKRLRVSSSKYNSE